MADKITKRAIDALRDKAKAADKTLLLVDLDKQIFAQRQGRMVAWQKIVALQEDHNRDVRGAVRVAVVPARSIALAL